MSEKAQVRLLSPWTNFVETQRAVFSADIPICAADALVAEWAPTGDLFEFPGPKAWYCCEPKCQFERIDNGRWPQLRARLASEEFLFHNHPDPRFRVPHITHFEELRANSHGNRLARAVAIVSNFGGGPRLRPAEIAYRNRFVTTNLVDLYGRDSWKAYRAHWWTTPRLPGNYKGAISGDWPAAEKRQLLATYKVAVCLENSYEPHYFTEKFVEAVVAGCIPVYRAHPTVREGVLAGAFWVDPADYAHDPICTIQAALGMDPKQFRAANASWLQSEKLRASHHLSVFARLAQILQQHSLPQ